MKRPWLNSLLAFIPVVAAALALQSCSGVGGPTTNNTGQGSVTADFLALLSDEQRTAKSITPEQCAACHTTGTVDDPIYAHWKDTTHFAKGVTCESCHGPGSAHRDNPSKSNILTFPKVSDPVVCAQCHGPINDQFNFSKHSKLIQDPVNEAVTNPTTYGRNSRCIACHSGLARAQIVERGIDLGTASDALIQQVGNDTVKSVPHTADCITCHNPHKKTGKLTQSGEEKQLRHQVFNVDITNISPGTTAAVFTNYDHLCAQCHNGRGADPSDAKLTTATSRPNMHSSNQMQMLMGFGGVEGPGPADRNTAHAQAPGQCTKCHMPDSRHTFTVSYDTSCSPCHTAADAASRADAVKSDVLNGLVALRARMEAWALKSLGNINYWEYTSNITTDLGTPPAQNLVPIQVKRARHNYYFIVRAADYGVHNAPYAKLLLKVANDNLTSIGVPAAVVRPMTRVQQQALIDSDKARAARAEAQSPE